MDRSANARRDYRRMPMPPIDFQAIEIKKLEEMLDLPAGEESDDEPGPEW